MDTLKYCPVCAEPLIPGKICSCGYDASLDCENYLTLCPQSGEAVTIRAQRERYRAELLERAAVPYRKRIAVLEAENAELKMGMATLQKQVSELAQERSRLQEKIAELAFKLEQTSAQNSRLFTELLHKNEQLSALKAQLAELELQLQKVRLKLAAGKEGEIHPGDILKLGSYPQGKTGEINPIEWIVIACFQNECLLLSKSILDRKLFNETANAVWAESDLHSWLNHAFLEAAFDDTEKALLLEHEVPAEPNPRYQSDPGSSTKDRVLLLSIPEAKKLMQQLNPKTQLTDFAASTAGEQPVWWLRTPGANSSHTAVVSLDGKIDYYGKKSRSDVCGVRPAVWIRI